MGSRRPLRAIWPSGLVRKCAALVLPFLLAVSAFATQGVFQGRVVEGTKREAGRFIYVEARAGSLRRVNIQRCRVRFDASVPASQRVRNAAEALRDSAQVRVVADQRENGEWVASDIVILKVPELDQARLRI